MKNENVLFEEKSRALYLKIMKEEGLMIQIQHNARKLSFWRMN